MLKLNTIVAFYVFFIFMVSLQQVACKKPTVGKQKRMYFRKQRIQYNKRGDTVPLGISLNGSPAANTNGLTSIPSIDTSSVQLPPLPDTSGLFSSISTVSGLTQKLPNLGSAAASTSPNSATGTTQLYQYVPQQQQSAAAAPAPIYQTAPVANTIPEEKDDDEDDEDDEEEDDD